MEASLRTVPEADALLLDVNKADCSRGRRTGTGHWRTRWCHRCRVWAGMDFEGAVVQFDTSVDSRALRAKLTSSSAVKKVWPVRRYSSPVLQQQDLSKRATQDDGDFSPHLVIRPDVLMLPRLPSLYSDWCGQATRSRLLWEGNVGYVADVRSSERLRRLPLTCSLHIQSASSIRCA